MRYYVICVGLAIAASVLLWAFASFTASAATHATMAGAEIELPARIWFAAGNFVSAYFVFLAGGLLCAAAAVATWLRSRQAS